MGTASRWDRGVSRGRKPESEPPGQHSRKKKKLHFNRKKHRAGQEETERDVFREPDSDDFSVWHLPIDAPAQGQVIRWSGGHVIRWSGECFVPPLTLTWGFHFSLSFFLPGATQRPTQRVPFEPPAAEPGGHLHHGVRLAPPTWETHSGLLRVRSNCESSFTDFTKTKRCLCDLTELASKSIPVFPSNLSLRLVGVHRGTLNQPCFAASFS